MSSGISSVEDVLVFDEINRPRRSGRASLRPLDVRRGRSESPVRPSVDIALPLVVNLCDQRAGRIDDVGRLRVRVFVLDGARDTVGAEDRHCAIRYFLEVFDEMRALGVQAHRRHDGCGRSRGARRPAHCAVASARSTMSIARTTPAQKPRGCARITFMQKPPFCDARPRSSAITCLQPLLQPSCRMRGHTDRGVPISEARLYALNVAIWSTATSRRQGSELCVSQKQHSRALRCRQVTVHL